MDIFLVPFQACVKLPFLALLPAGLFALWYSRRKEGLLWGAALAWLSYGLYESIMWFWARSVSAPIRVDMMYLVPFLYFISAAACVAAVTRSHQT